MQEIVDKAKRSLDANLVSNDSNEFIVAGGHQFKTLWVRDFCYSVQGLLKYGKKQLVHDQLRLILKFMNNEYQLPRGLDVCNPKTRVLWASFMPGIGFPKVWGDYSTKKIIPEYLGEHLTIAYDSNLLFLKSSLDSGFISEVSENQIEKLLSVYKLNPWILQPGYSDWQDSVSRKGPILLTHLLYLEVLLRLKEMGSGVGLRLWKDHAENLAGSIRQKFFVESRMLFRETLDQDQISLDSHILLLTGPQELQRLLKIDPLELYESLKKDSLWKSSPIPGVPVFPDHRSEHVGWTVKVVGLRHYHDGFVWGWLSAEAYRLAKTFHDHLEADRIATLFAKANQDFSFLSEIYSYESQNSNSLRPYQSVLYRSERPFTWTSAKWLEALL
jgi:hypothetical protein